MSIIKSAEPELLSVKATCQLLGYESRGILFRLERSDPTFPAPRKIGNSEFSIAYLRSELMAWLHAQPKRELTGESIIDRRKQHQVARMKAAS
ncbi:hypothetical protein BH10PSE17_BH10PSE17_25210 [soil metagenome]